MKTIFVAAAFAIVLHTVSIELLEAQVPPYPSTFSAQRITTNGATFNVRVGGNGPPVVLLHGYGETGDMWAPLAAKLARTRTVIVPDLRGMGLSSHPTAGYEKKNQAVDLAGILDSLKVERIELVTHDIGNMVGFAFAAMYRGRVSKFALIDAPVPGVGPWEEILKNPLLWHFRFGGLDMERLVAGRERIYLDRFWNEFSANPANFNEGSRQHYARLYARPGAMHSGFLQFKAFDQDAVDNRALLAAGGPLTMPLLAIGGEKSFGTGMAAVMRAAATDVREGVIPAAGHWIMEENPAATVSMVAAFLEAKAPGQSAPREMPASRDPTSSANEELRLTPDEIARMTKGGAGAGSSGVSGIQTTVLSGDPTKAGPYTIEIRVPANTRIDAHTHRDSRSAVVVSGMWYFGYGSALDSSITKTLGPGSFYTEPLDAPHFALTREQPAVVYITGFGPTDTRYVSAARRQGDKQ